MTSIEQPETLFKAIRVLVPGTGSRFRCGGLSVAKQTVRLLSKLRPTTLVTYRERSLEHPFLEDLLNEEPPDGKLLWIISWGFDVPRLLRRLHGRNVLYHAHSSSGKLPPIFQLCCCRNTMGYWVIMHRETLIFVPMHSTQMVDRGI